MVALDEARAQFVLSTRGTDDSGVLIKMGTNTFGEAVLTAADPANPRTFAAALASDGFYVYYATDGTIAGGASFGVFRFDLFGAGAVPERLADLPVAGGGIAIDGTDLYWSEPANNRIMHLAL